MNPSRCIPFLLTAFLTAAPPATLRVDFTHSGNATMEIFSLDQVVQEPLPWPGNPAKSLDDSNLGKYYFEVVDRATNRVLYSRGFCSIYGEWETTEEAKRVHKSFQESLRFPQPEKPVQINLKKRDPHNAFKEIWSFVLNPADKFIQRVPPPRPERIEILKNGEPSNKVDLLILGDGYTAAERKKFEQDARRMTEILFNQAPFKERKSDFNVWALCPPAQESGIARPSEGLQRRSPLGCTYDAFDSERYVLSFDNRAWRDVACWAPYEFVQILVNNRTYGGGGIHGLFGTVAADNAFAPYIFVHEFGHHFAGLADEYYTSDVAYEQGKERIEPWEPNVTADAQHPKWKSLLTPGLALPSPWSKAEFEKQSYAIQKERKKLRADKRPESEMEALFHREQGILTPLLAGDQGKIGSFEGANYEATGYFRSQTDCIMFTRDEVPFCAACQAAIRRVIDQHTSK